MDKGAAKAEGGTPAPRGVSDMYISGTRSFATGTKNWCQVLVPVFWYQNLVPVSGMYVMGFTFPNSLLLQDHCHTHTPALPSHTSTATFISELKT